MNFAAVWDFPTRYMWLDQYRKNGYYEDAFMTQQIQLRDGDDFIRLGQAMKLAGTVSSGVEAKILITEGEVTVNGEVETRRGRKLYPGDVFSYEDEEITIVQ